MDTVLQHTLVKLMLSVAAKAVNSKYPCRRYFGRRDLARADLYDFFSKTEMYTQYKYEEFEGFTQAYINLELENYYYYPELLQVEHKFCTLGNLPSE